MRFTLFLTILAILTPAPFLPGSEATNPNNYEPHRGSIWFSHTVPSTQRPMGSLPSTVGGGDYTFTGNDLTLPPIRHVPENTPFSFSVPPPSRQVDMPPSRLHANVHQQYPLLNEIQPVRQETPPSRPTTTTTTTTSRRNGRVRQAARPPYVRRTQTAPQLENTQYVRRTQTAPQYDESQCETLYMCYFCQDKPTIFISAEARDNHHAKEHSEKWSTYQADRSGNIAFRTDGQPHGASMLFSLALDGHPVVCRYPKSNGRSVSKAEKRELIQRWSREAADKAPVDNTGKNLAINHDPWVSADTSSLDPSTSDDNIDISAISPSSISVEASVDPSEWPST